MWPRKVGVTANLENCVENKCFICEDRSHRNLQAVASQLQLINRPVCGRLLLTFNRQT